jgi:DNA-binding GntR family transcriptional regulator
MQGVTEGSAFQEAYSWLKQRIRDGRLAGGTRIKAEDVAGELGMSRMPVREAIRQLASEGLITLRPNRGAVVTALSSDDMREILEMRAALEGLAARRAAQRATAADLAELEEDLRRLNAASADMDLWIARHDRLHERIAEMAGAPRLAAEIRQLRTAMEPCLRLGVAGPKMAEAMADHARLLAALASRDPERAEVCMREHVEETARAML